MEIFLFFSLSQKDNGGKRRLMRAQFYSDECSISQSLSHILSTVSKFPLMQSSDKADEKQLPS